MSKNNKSKVSKLSLKSIMISFATVPLLIGGLICTIYLVEGGKSQVQEATLNSMLSVVNETGIAYDEFITSAEDTLKGFAQAPVVREALLHPEDANLTAEAQAYTTSFYGGLREWEGIYIADWNSKVITHPAAPVVGKVMREGDALESLRNSMLNADNGIFNTGIISSPASGELIVSMYVPVYDDNGNAIGYVGGGTYIANISEKLTNVSSLKLDTAYTYIVDPNGTMLYHPDETKIGNPVENEVVKGVVADIQAGNHPEPESV